MIIMVWPDDPVHIARRPTGQCCRARASRLPDNASSQAAESTAQRPQGRKGHRTFGFAEARGIPVPSGCHVHGWRPLAPIDQGPWRGGILHSCSSALLHNMAGTTVMTHEQTDPMPSRLHSCTVGPRSTAAVDGFGLHLSPEDRCAPPEPAHPGVVNLAAPAHLPVVRSNPSD